VHEKLQFLQQCSSARTSGKAWENNSSSWSHAVFQLILRRHGTEDIHGKFSTVDLLGKERPAVVPCSNYKTGIEDAKINKSLLTLMECNRALGTNHTHSPFPGSKLTHILRDSFVGMNSRACIIAAVSAGIR
jgi:kinesin family protein 2/24